MNPDTQQRLAHSLTADSTDIIPYLPYLLQDFWSLASEPQEMIDLLRRHIAFDAGCKMLDLACGKGVASVCLAREFGCAAKGIDLIPEFIAEAKEKAVAYSVADLCTFVVGDVNEAVEVERGYDLTVWGGAGDLLGGYRDTLAGIARTVKAGGYFLLDDAYADGQLHPRFHHDYLTTDQWQAIFDQCGLTVIARNGQPQQHIPSAYATDLANIRKRADELIRQHPDKQALFNNYVNNQQAEYEDLHDGVAAALWLLHKHE